MISTKRTDGFTLIELMLSMAFIAFVLLFIVTAILQTTRMYSKGLTIRQINQTGRQLSDELQRNIRYDSPTYVDTKQRLCTGKVSYAWNKWNGTTVYQENNYVPGPGTGVDINLVRVKDVGKTLCTAPYPAIPFGADTKELLGSLVILQTFDPQVMPKHDNALTTIDYMLSTSGADNAPIKNGTDICCPDGLAGSFCALGEFNVAVYSRNELKL